jgi:threonine dehydrogenase-like Zn-dependent dehydrogenase
METALNILWDARPLVGERALVVGAGAVGLLAARLLARMPGAAVAVHDPDPRGGARPRRRAPPSSPRPPPSRTPSSW